MRIRTDGKLVCVGLLLVIMLLAPALADAAERITLQYARNFQVRYQDQVTLVTVTSPWRGAGSGFCYLLKPRGSITPSGHEECQVIETPVRSMAALSSTYLAFIDRLGLTDRLVAVNDAARVHTKSIRQAAQAGRVVSVGQGPNLQVETLLDLQPEVIFTFATGGFRDVHPKLLEAGLQVAVCAEYMEAHPLGRAEWIKFIALFFGRERRANQVFDGIVQRYREKAALARRVSHRPTVLTNTPFNGSWGVSAGGSFIARFLADAGGDYIWKDVPGQGSRPTDIELVYDRGREAEFWLNTGIWTSLAQARAADPRLADFRSLRTGNLFNNNRRLNAAGGNDYWETGMVEPDVILADLIRILHPELEPEHELYYYRKLR
ncbi:ABC transporter substrate-binding protein [Desulfolithobacter sp.]